MCVADSVCPIRQVLSPKTLLLAYLIRCSPINIFLTSSRPGTACQFLEASTRAGSRHVAFPPPLLPIRGASQQFLDSFHFSLVFSLVIMHSQLQPLAARVHRDLRCPSNSVPAQWIRSVMINTHFYLPAPKKSCHHPNSQAMAMQPLKLRRWKRMSQGIHPPGMRTRARSLDKIGRRLTNSSTIEFKSLKDFRYVGSSYRPRLVQHLSPF
jgi:hypothetical protein